MLPPPNHVPDPIFGIGPGVAHAPPYTTELANGVRGLGEGAVAFADQHLQKRMVEVNIEIPVVFITGHGDVPMSVRAIKADRWGFCIPPRR